MATANFNDMAILGGDQVFGNRVASALWTFCTVSIPSEAVTDTTARLHLARKAYAQQILNNPVLFKPFFVNAVSVNQIVANEATAAGTLVGLTPTQVATAALLCLDADISNAVAASFNSFVSGL